MSKQHTIDHSIKLVHIKSILSLFVLLFLSPLLQSTAVASQSEEGWKKLIDLTEAVLGEGGLLDAKDTESQIDAIVDLHAKYCTEILGKPISAQQILTVKQGIRLFMKTVGKRYTGDKRGIMLKLIKDLITNRAIFAELLTSNETSEVIEVQTMAYLERNQNLSYKEPVPISEQIIVPSSETPLQIVADQIRMISDKGTSGHYNKAIDAGEVITLNIPLKNVSDKPFRSTSGFLQTKDEFVQTDVSEVIYTEKDVISGETVTFAPGKTVVPKSHFTFTVSPACPDGHEIKFELLIWDSDYGKFTIPFSIKVYNVGPLDFGTAKIDDDIPGDSDGDSDGIMEVNEIIEYVLQLRNVGHITISDVNARLFVDLLRLNFNLMVSFYTIALLREAVHNLFQQVLSSR